MLEFYDAIKTMGIKLNGRINTETFIAEQLDKTKLYMSIRDDILHKNGLITLGNADNPQCTR